MRIKIKKFFEGKLFASIRRVFLATIIFSFIGAATVCVFWIESGPEPERSHEGASLGIVRSAEVVSIHAIESTMTWYAAEIKLGRDYPEELADVLMHIDQAKSVSVGDVIYFSPINSKWGLNPRSAAPVFCLVDENMAKDRIAAGVLQYVRSKK